MNFWKKHLQQVEYLRLFEQLACLVFLLPVFLSGRSAKCAVFCGLAGFALWCLRMTLLTWERKENGKCMAGLGSSAVCSGRMLLWFAGILYCVTQAAVFLRLTAYLSARCLFPQVSETLLSLFFSAAAVLLVLMRRSTPGWVRKRVGAVFVFALLLVSAAVLWKGKAWVWHSEAWIWNGVVPKRTALLGGSVEVWACLEGVFWTLPVQEREKDTDRSEKAGGCAARTKWLRCAAGLCGLVCAVILGSPAGTQTYGSVLSAGILLPGLFLAAKDTLCHAGTMLQKGQHWYFVLVLVCFGAVGFLSVWTALGYYRAMHLQILLPFFLFMDAAEERCVIPGERQG